MLRQSAQHLLPIRRKGIVCVMAVGIKNGMRHRQNLPFFNIFTNRTCNFGFCVLYLKLFSSAALQQRRRPVLKRYDNSSFQAYSYLVNFYHSIFYQKMQAQPKLRKREGFVIMELEQQKRYRAWAEIDLSALEHNVRTVQSMLPQHTQYMAVVKANAYGHGDEAICKKLWELGVRWFAVSNLEEALSVREYCPYGEIFILATPRRNLRRSWHGTTSSKAFSRWTTPASCSTSPTSRCAATSSWTPAWDASGSAAARRRTAPGSCFPCLSWSVSPSRASTPTSPWQTRRRQTTSPTHRRRRTSLSASTTSWQSWDTPSSTCTL